MDTEELYRVIHDGHPTLKFCERFDDHSPQWNMTRHAHPHIELLYFTEGLGSLEAGETRIQTSLYDTVVYPAYCEHMDGVVTEHRREIICLQIDLPGLQLQSPMLLHDSNSGLFTLFQFVYREGKRRDRDERILEYAIRTLLTMIIRENGQAHLSNRSMELILQYIQEHVTSHLSLEQIARQGHISKSYLVREFKKNMGMTVGDYMNGLRIELAKRELLNGRRSVSDVAYEVGFESAQYFQRLFLKSVGCTPAEYRRQSESAT